MAVDPELDPLTLHQGREVAQHAGEQCVSYLEVVASATNCGNVGETRKRTEAGRTRNCPLSTPPGILWGVGVDDADRHGVALRSTQGYGLQTGWKFDY